MNSLMGGNIMMQALGAMMRGESPQMFLQNLAKNNPALQGMDFSNLENTAQKLCNEKGRGYGTGKPVIFWQTECGILTN